MIKRISGFKYSVFLVLYFLIGLCTTQAQPEKRPNVILIITDDQGFGDLGFNGNKHILTPAIDNLARESVRFNKFYVSPVCAPTRSSLMTGRYSLRTGVHDTYNGGAIMSTDEYTIAEMLKDAGYVTGAFGKWHLGDNYPCRPNDQGFDESLIHLSGGMGQVGDITTFFKSDSSYFDPVLWKNGQQKKYSGYCSDIFAREAIAFIGKNYQSPFFCYLAFNAPHTPLQVPEKYYKLYSQIDPATGYDKKGLPPVRMSEKDKEDARKAYAMVTNIDDNVGLLVQRLNELGIAENTVLIFMTDNGPQQTRYVAGMRGKKGSVYNGGIRVPFYFRYPKELKGNMDISTAAMHIDILPTLAELCQAELPKGRKIDGKSLLPLMRGQSVDWADRSLFFYWTRKYPELYNNIALQKGRYKLVGHTDFNAEIADFELFDIEKDPYELTNRVGELPALAKQLKYEMDQIFYELVNSPNMLNPMRIVIGSDEENPVVLNRNDAEGDRGIWAQEEIYGKWRVRIMEGVYDLKFKFLTPVEPNGQMVVETNTFINQAKNHERTDEIIMKNVYLPSMDCDLVPFYLIGNKRIFPFWVESLKTN